MNKMREHKYILVFLMSFIIIHLLFAFPAPPMKAYYYSSNKIYRLLIIPNKFEENTNNFYLGKLSKLDRDNIYQPVYSCHLDNHPVSAIISDDGNYFVTFSYKGGNDVVIYGSEGKIIKKYYYEDILADKDLKELENIWNEEGIFWGDGHFIDDETKTLVLGISPNLNINRPSSIHTLRIDLKTGKINKYDTLDIKTFNYGELVSKPEPIYLPKIDFPHWYSRPDLYVKNRKNIYKVYGYSWKRFNVKVELLIDIDGNVSSVKIMNPEAYSQDYFYLEYILRETIKAKFYRSRNFDKSCQVIIRGVYIIIPNKPSILEIKGH